ncbi:MAG TPA: dTMP kinase [Dehalococcoidia bacterium]|nr:dTMP kinase [Dehalococcoidia bacterium]
MTEQQGLFLALEGGEGAGKSTLMDELRRRIEDVGREVTTTREPGGTPLGEQIRDLLRSNDLSPWSETFLFVAARAQLVSKVIRPALDAGHVVLCDRYAASTLAYQGHGRDLDMTRLKAVNVIATGGLQPDLTLLIDIDPAEGLGRKSGETGAVNTGYEAAEFHDRVREGYRALAQQAQPGTWVTLDGSTPPEEVTAVAWNVVKPRVKPRELGSD